MPIFVLSSNICPEGVEATVFALLASVGNLGFFSSEFLGGVMVDIFGVKQGEYSNFWVVIFLRGLLRLSPLLYIRLVPDDTGEATALVAAVEPGKEWELSAHINQI